MLALLLSSVACGHWKPARGYEVPNTLDAKSTYGVILDVVKHDGYQVLEENEGLHRVQVRAHYDEKSAEHNSYITAQVAPDGKVQLVPSGYAVRNDGSIHKKLAEELSVLERQITNALRAGPSTAASNKPVPVAASASVPHAWSEPAYDPKAFGPGDFTCLPVKLPEDEQRMLKIRLSNGEDADVVLSLAYAPELCRSPSQCRLPGGCPALGIGDSTQVSKLAERLAKNEVASQATLLHRDKPVAVLDLSRHGSIAQAMTQYKR
jgi:hypothetical protein